ncbi:probable helicase senataxin isoform X2 [Sceloporus undulatus]|nr:probable helicase senataxin isoform X2 [Sceloporus undulatus]
MLLTVLEEQAMDSLLLGPDKQNDFMQSIMNIMRKETDDESNNPFWPALHCFMVILDKLGSKVWGQLIDPIQAFQTIINNASYKKEVESIRTSCRRTKSEPLSDYGDEMVTCSQIVYNYHPERPNKDTGWRTAVCPDYCPNLYEDMQTLTDMLQCDILRDMRLHNSTFLWFIPFVHSLMDLRDMGVAYSVVVIHHLCSEIKDTLNDIVQSCDKVSEFFIWILVSIVELSFKKNGLHLLWVSSETWVEVIVKCTSLPSAVFLRGVDRGVSRNCSRSTAGMPSWEPESVQLACMNLIRNILKEGYQVGQKNKQFLDELNLLRRSREAWKLSPQQAQELQECLKLILRSIWNKSLNLASHRDSSAVCSPPTSLSIKQERFPVNPHHELPSYMPPKGREDACDDGSSSRRSCNWGKEASSKDQNLQGTLVCNLNNIKQEPKDNLTQAHNNMSSLFANGQMGAQKNGSCCQELEGQSTQDAAHKTSLSNQSFHHIGTKDVSGKKKSPKTSEDLAEKDHHDKKGGGTSEVQMGLNNLMNNNRPKKSDWTLKLKLLVENKKRENTSLGPAAEKQQSDKDGDKSQKSQKGGVVESDSSVSLGKSGAISDEQDQQGQLLSIKQESKDRLAENRNTLGAEEDPEESSSDDEMANVPLSLIRKDLVKKKAASATSPVTDSQIDKDLNKLSIAAYAKATSFPVDSSQEDTTYCQDRIKRKVQGALRNWSDRESSKSSSDVDEPPIQVIIISDTSSDEDENKEDVVRKSKPEKTGECPEKPSTSALEQAASSNSPLLYADYESQCFEFETEDDIYSVWQNSQMNETTEAKSPPTACSPALPNLGVAKQLSDCGYDTDYLGDDITEKAADDLEQQVKQQTKAKPHVPAAEGFDKRTSAPHSHCFTEIQADDGGCSKYTDPLLPGISTSPGLSSSTSVVKKSTIQPEKSLAKSCENKTANRSPAKRCVKSNVHSRKSPPGATSLLTPAVVPPHKVHKFPGPTSLTEKLGLTKRTRRAAELSQRTQDSITKLREYGKTAGELPQKRKAKLIQPQHLIDRNKKMLTCQDRYLLSHRRQKEIERGHCANSRNKTAKKTAPKRCSESAGSTVVIENQKEKAIHSSHSSSSERKQLRQSSPETDRVQSTSIPLAKEFPLSKQESISSHTNIQESTSAVSGNLSFPVTESSKTDPTVISSATASLSNEGVASKDGVSELNEKVIGEDDGLFLTQKDPVDMELCSQMENEIHSPDLPQNPLQDDSSGFPKCKRAGCPRKGDGAGGYCEEHSAHDQPDHLFAKPFPPVKLSTTKMFSSSSSSRTANLTKELETITKTPVASKSKPIPIRPPASDGLKLRTPTLKSILQPQNPNSITQLQSGQNSHSPCNSRMLPTVRVGSRQDTRSSCPQLNGSAQHRDHSIFIKEVLKWSYDMFANVSQLGPPDHLLQSVVASVPVRFQDYNDYFNTLFPLTMLNAFEEVAQEWLDNQKAKEQKPFYLHLLNFNANLNKADFTANISQSDLDRQLHPKEDDLVFLKASEKRSYCEEEETEGNLIRFVGLVTRFSHPTIRDSKRKEHQVVCHLSIQTQANLSRVDKQVRCVVVSSLVTTQRRFRALLLLNRSPLAKPIISPSYSDFCPKVLNTDSERYISCSREFNEEQRRAIEVACAMVTQHPSLPKICLIHGPPGTGKSKTIVGLLHRILSERSGKENPVQSLNAKIKRNRVLVCAPSNAAVDDLMKKIILEFKEKCQNKNNPLGNCGDINLVRLGQQKSISKDVRKFSLNDQIDHRINRATLGKDQHLQKSKEDLDRQLDMLSRQRAMDRSEKREKKQQLDEEICRLSKERQRLASQLKEVHGRSQELKASIILESHILCCTLSTSGGVLLESAFRRLGGDPVSCVIVDEAGQTCEVETLIPLIHGCKKLVLVGDPKQLPPTVKSVKAQNYGYDQSLMGRLCSHLQEQVQENVMGRLPVLQLTTQYRMHPEICLFPSKYIYGHALKTDRQTAENRFSLEWPFQPYLLFDVLDGKEERDSDSYANPQEVRLVIELMKLIKEKRRDIGYRHIGIITPYSAQKRRIRKQLDREFGENSASEVDTVDGFQGREKDCIIVTCVRANSTQGSIGFLRSLQRLNVTITRAKYSLFILGKLKTLMESKDWNELIQDAQKRGNIIQTSSSSYKSCALKILKSRPLPNLGIPIPKRAPLRHTDTARREQNEASNHVSQPTTANSGAFTEGSTAAQRLSVLHEPSSSVPLPPQARPVEERPKDPRLVRRAESTLQVGTCKVGHLSGVSGGEIPQSHAVHRLSSNAETTGNPISNAYAAAMVVPAKLSGPYATMRVCLSADEAKTLGQGDHSAPHKPSQKKDCHSRGRRFSRADSPDPLDTKRRRTTC